LKIERTYDGARTAAIFDHPNAAALAEDRNNWCFVAEGGAWLFLRLCAGLYEGHAAVVPEYRGEWTREAGIACLWRLFVESDALEVVLRPAADNLAAIAGCRMLGAHREFVTEPRMPGKNDALVSQHVYVLTLTGFLGFMFGDDPAAYARFAAVCPRKGNAAFRRFWSLSGRIEPCPLLPSPLL
jgi:hypothetical protein